MRITELFASISVMLFLCGAARADRTVWYVHPDSLLNTIQAGLYSCADNDIVLVGPGTYYEHINWPNRQGVHLISEVGPDATIIDGDSTGQVIRFTTFVDTTTMIRGFTIQNGYGQHGGGISCGSDGSPKITGNTFTSNSAITYGGGIKSDGSSPHIEGNTFDNNYAGVAGGGIHVSGNTSPNIIGNTLIYNSARAGGGIRVGSSCSAFIMDNFINRNYAVVKGGGIECWNVCSPIIRCNTITDNSGYYGSGIHCDWGSTPIIDSCIISDNRNGHGIWCEDGANPVIRHNNITDNEGDALHNTYFLIHINADSNWWGHSTGPYHPIANPGGLGDTVSNHVDFDPWVTEPFSWGIEEYEVAEPIVITLQISPNPFRDKVNIKCSKEYNTGALAFTIYDATGRAVHEFNDLNSSVFSWNATDNFNRRLSSGVYILKVEGGDYCATEKLLLIR